MGEEKSLTNLNSHQREEIAALKTHFDVVRFMRQTCGQYGLKHFIVFKLPGFGAETLSAYSIVSNWPKEVLAKYDELRMVRHGTGIRRLLVTTVPFTCDMCHRFDGSSADCDFLELLDLLKANDIRFGHFFPVHDALGNRAAIVWGGENETLPRNVGLELQMVSTCIFGRLVEIGTALKSEQVELSEREIACLNWTAAGKTSFEIGAILGISESTVNHYLNHTSRKLDAVNRTQAVVTALRRGIIG